MALYVYHLHSAATATRVINFKSKQILTEETLKRALQILHGRHPFLRASIEITGERSADYLLSSIDEIPLEIITQDPGSDRWLEIFERQANYKLELLGPLARVVLLIPAENDIEDESGLYSQYVYLTIHHAIEDGTCCTNLLSEMLELCGCIDTNTTSNLMQEKLSLLDTPPDLLNSRHLNEQEQIFFDEKIKPIQEKIEKHISETTAVGKPIKGHVVKDILEEMNALDCEMYQQELEAGCYDNKKLKVSTLRALLKESEFPINTITPRPPKNESSAERYTAIFPLRLSKEDTMKIIKGCRANGTTVHAALMAGLLFGSTQHLKDNTDDIIFFPVHCAVNMRNRLGIDKQHLGFYASSIGTYPHLVPNESNFWDVAKDIKAQLNSFNERDVHCLPHTLGKELSPGMEMFIGQLKNFQTGPPVFRALGISNMGVADLKTNYGPYEVESLLQTACCGGLTEAVIFVTTTHQQMFMNMTYARGFMSEEEASKIIHDTLFYVYSAIDNPELIF